jgi:outer membrane protein OmpA-like peptidoglycan-associated protein
MTRHWEMGGGIGGGMGSGVYYLTPFAAFTYTGNINATTSPFLTAGTEFTRVAGNGRITHAVWGARVGIGLRHFLSDNVALRGEARMGFEHFAAMPGSQMAYNPILTLGLSYFTAGRHALPAALAPPPCPVCIARARVDTVWRTTPPPAAIVIVLRDTLVLEGVNFAFDSSALTPESHWVLDRVAQAMLKPEWANSRWEIAGHTSAVGSDEYNMALSQRRAESVRAYLVTHGVLNPRLVPKGYGETSPKYPNDSEGRNWRNRRVELRRIK